LVEWRVRDSTGGRKISALTPDLGQAALQKPLFRLLPRKGKRRLIAGFGLGEATKAPQQIGLGSVREVIAGKTALVDQGLDEREPSPWAVTHRHRRGPVQLDDRGGLNPRQRVIEAYNLPPICFPRSVRFTVNGGDGGLQGVGTETA
jgi:hypothetical protein